MTTTKTNKARLLDAIERLHGQILDLRAEVETDMNPALAIDERKCRDAMNDVRLAEVQICSINLLSN